MTVCRRMCHRDIEGGVVTWVMAEVVAINGVSLTFSELMAVHLDRA